MNCCDDFGQCTQGPDCPARTHLFTQEGGKKVDTKTIDLSLYRELDAERADREAWRGMVRSTVILLLGIALGALISIAAIAAGVSAGA